MIALKFQLKLIINGKLTYFLKGLLLVPILLLFLLIPSWSPATPPLTQSNTTSTTNLASTSSLPSLGLGDQGNSVKTLQTELKKQGYFTGAIDGLYDIQTETAVYNFQVSQGLFSDGLVGQETWDALRLNISPSPSLADAEFPNDIQNILDGKKLVIAVLGIDNPPFFQINSEGKLVGLDIELGQSLAEELGVDVQFDRSAQTFNEVVERVQNHQADLAISKLSISTNRAKKILFSLPYVTMRQGLLVNRLELAKKAQNQRPEAVIQNLDGKLGVIKGTQYALVFAKRKFPNAEIVEFPTWDDVVAAVKSGKILAAYRDELEVKKVLLQKPDVALDIQTVALTDTKDLLSVVIHRDHNNLQNFVNTYLEINSFNYSVDQLIDKYPDFFKPRSSR